MPCLVCKEPQTVRSHIFPKALIREMRGGSGHLLVGSKNYTGSKPLPGGVFSNHILCREHENATAEADRYAVELLRRSMREHRSKPIKESFRIENPAPQQLRKFALSCIWRHIAAAENGTSAFGSYRSTFLNGVFGAELPDWPVLIMKDRMHAGEAEIANFGLYPYRTRIAARNAWTFTVFGFTFYLICDQQSLHGIDAWRADLNDPAPILISDPQNVHAIPILQPIFRNMRGKPSRYGPGTR